MIVCCIKFCVPSHAYLIIEIQDVNINLFAEVLDLLHWDVLAEVLRSGSKVRPGNVTIYGQGDLRLNLSI